MGLKVLSTTFPSNSFLPEDGNESMDCQESSQLPFLATFFYLKTGIKYGLSGEEA